MISDQFTVSRYLSELAGELKQEFTGGRVKVLAGKVETELNLYAPVMQGGKILLGLPGRFEVKMPIPPTPGFLVKKNDFIDCAAECISLAHDFQMGDETFDRKYYIKVDDVEWACQHFDKEVSLCIADILAAGFDRVFISARTLRADKFVRTLSDCPSAEDIQRAISRLADLSINHMISDFKGELPGLRDEIEEGAHEEATRADSAPGATKSKEFIQASNSAEFIPDSTMFYLASMMFVPIAIPIIVGLSASFLSTRFGDTLSLMYVILFTLPTFGCWLGYRGYAAQRKKAALQLCLSVNAFYAVLLLIGIIMLA